MYELPENPAENSKRHLTALSGITDMWEGLGNHPAASHLPSPAGRSSGQLTPVHELTPCMLIPATYSSFAPF